MEKSNNSYDEIRYLNLKNQGGFVVKLECWYKLAESATPKRIGTTKKILLGQNKTLDLQSIDGLPQGAYVTAYANVEAGTDLPSDKKPASIWFIYKSESTLTADFVISGTTTIDTLGYVGIK